MSERRRIGFPVKTAVMFVAAVLYIVLIADWCVPGYGLHLAAVVLGGHGQVETPLSWFSPWGLLVHFIGWDVRGLGVLSAFVLTPGFLRAATTVDPILPLLAVFLTGLAILIRLYIDPKVRAEVDALDVLRFNRRHLRANAVMGTINGVRGNTAGLQVMLTNLRRIAGLSKTHQKEVEVLGK